MATLSARSESFADWGVLVDTDAKGTYIPSSPMRIDDPPLASWILEATMFASDSTSIDFRSLANSPALFPFHLTSVTPEALANSGRLEIVRHGVADDLVLLRKTTKEAEHRSRIH